MFFKCDSLQLICGIWKSCYSPKRKQYWVLRVSPPNIESLSSYLVAVELSHVLRWLPIGCCKVLTSSHWLLHEQRALIGWTGQLTYTGMSAVVFTKTFWTSCHWIDNWQNRPMINCFHVNAPKMMYLVLTRQNWLKTNCNKTETTSSSKQWSQILGVHN